MFSMTKKAALVGIGFSERLKEVIAEFKKRGEDSQGKEALRLKRFFESLEKGEEGCVQLKDRLRTQISDKICLPKREDITRLEREISDLARKFRQWEASGQSKDT